MQTQDILRTTCRNYTRDGNFREEKYIFLSEYTTPAQP